MIFINANSVDVCNHHFPLYALDNSAVVFVSHSGAPEFVSVTEFFSTHHKTQNKEFDKVLQHCCLLSIVIQLAKFAK